MIQVVNLFTNHPFVKLWDIPVSSIPGGSIDESFARHSWDFSFLQTSALSIYKYQSFD